ncbi:FAD-dependent oxidoreductase domain-containing protein 1 [Hydra vulgaris]|uniref:FAD-dependent oxidoreductase domain-containing protein 1 n=1 Tax=Hydra vulgaris TaxID=6087 RepID=A0ABM4BED4_HYDVU
MSFPNCFTPIFFKFLPRLRNIHYDVVIIGGGVMGSSSAYFLKFKEPSLKIAVVEKDSTYMKASSALSVSSIRQQFSCPENINLSRWSYNFLKNINKNLFIDGEAQAPDIQLFQSSYMFLASSLEGQKILESNISVQRKCGVDVEILSCNGLLNCYPWLNIDGIVAGSKCNANEGWFDGWSLLQAFRKKAVSLGVDYINGHCTHININSFVSSVQIMFDKESHILDCRHMVNAAGPWAGELMQLVNIHLPVLPRKRYVFVFDCPNGPGRLMPLTVDPTGVYCRPEGSGTLYLAGCSPSESDEPDCSNLDVNYDYFNEVIWPVLATRFIGMETLKLKHSWSGYYDYNTFDQNGIIGPHSDIPNLYFANGFSGHGIQQSPAVGNAISEYIIDGKFSVIDLHKFRYGRIRENKPIREINVV